jgi:hypothetical protein
MSGDAIATTCYGTLTLAQTGGGTIPTLQSPYISQFIPDAVTPANSKLYYCGRNGVISQYECYSLAQAPGATWTLVIFKPPLTTIPISFYWFTYNSQIFIATDNQVAVLNLAAAQWSEIKNLVQITFFQQLIYFC